MNIAQRLKNEGIEEGKKKSQLKVALMSLQLGLNIEIISKINELSLSEIQALIDRPSTIASCEAKRLSVINAAG